MAEIERKFLLRALPAIDLGRGDAIRQGYVLDHPPEIRVRERGSRYFLTVKGEGTLTRAEWQTEIPRDVFDTLWPATAGRRLEKTRYLVPHGDLTIEIDDYHANLAGLVTLECEFSDEQDAARFQLPDWARDAVEVTEDERFRNEKLVLTGFSPADWFTSD